MVYSAGRPTPNEQLKNFPPTFLLAAAADQWSSQRISAKLWLDMNRAGATAEIQHLPKRPSRIRRGVIRVPSLAPGWMRFAISLKWMDSSRVPETGESK